MSNDLRAMTPIAEDEIAWSFRGVELPAFTTADVLRAALDRLHEAERQRARDRDTIVRLRDELRARALRKATA